MGACLQQYDSSNQPFITTLRSMVPPSPSFVVGTTDATLRFIDCRQQRYLHDFKVTTVPAGKLFEIQVMRSNTRMVGYLVWDGLYL